ncbi:hypothetical protein QVD17_37339 [Tagetes erecta]|uniref:DCD domain-containing protein n=1 Tax=Tagetes erecta TaxID=13708 RepID=A0AAD8JU22_TARER|nr:hypothetical protein QVD17_37339 [Tagetes erecta]
MVKKKRRILNHQHSTTHFRLRLRLLIEEMGYKSKSVQGEIPESGAIFMSNSETKAECFKRELFGLPSRWSDFVLRVKKGMILFLFEFERRLLYGVFRATCDGEINIEPKAFRSSGKHIPAQVRFTTIWDCSPLAEHEFKGVIRDNYYVKNKFHFGLNKIQVSKLLKLFSSKSVSENHLERNIWRYDDKPEEGIARSHDLRKDIRHRIRFDSCDSRGDEVKDVDDNMYIYRHIIESRQKNKREEFSTRYMVESDEFDDRARHDTLGKHIDLREKHVGDDYMPLYSKRHGKHLDEVGAGRSDFLMDGGNKYVTDYNGLQDEYKVRTGFQGILNEHDMLGKHLDLRENQTEDGYMSVFNKLHGKHLNEFGAGSSDFLMDGGNKDVIDYNKLQDEYRVRTGFQGISKEHDILGKHLDLRESRIEDGYIPVFSKPHGKHLIEISARSSDYLRDSEDKDISDYNRLQDEYRVRKRVHGILNEHPLTNRVFSHFNQNSYSNCDPTGIDALDIQFSPSCFDGRLSYRPTTNNCPIYPSPEKILESKSLMYYPPDEVSIPCLDDPIPCLDDPIPCLDDPASQSSIFPKFISRKLSLSDSGERVHEEHRTDNDKRFHEKHGSRCTSGAANKRGSVFSRLTSTLKQEEKAFETDEKHDVFNASVDKVMQFLEKVVSSPINRTAKSISVIKQEDHNNYKDNKSEDYDLPAANNQVDTGEPYEEVEGESVLRETRLVDFKRRKNSNKRIDRTFQESSECLVGSKSDVGPPVEADQLTDVPPKRRKLVRPAFVEKNRIPVGVIAHERKLSENASVSTKVDEITKKVAALIKSTDDIIMVSTSLENTLSENDTVSTKVVDTLEKVDAVIKSTDDIIMAPTSPENTLSENDTASTKVVEISEKMDAVIKPTDDIIMAPTSPENTLSENDTASTKVVEISEKMDAVIKPTDDIIMAPTSPENRLSENDTASTKVVEISKKMDAVIKPTGNIIMMPTSLEHTLSENNSVLTKVGETSEKVDAAIRSTDDIIIVPTSPENTLSENDTISANVGEISEKVDTLDDVIMVPTSLETTLSENDTVSTKVGETSEKVDAVIKSADDMIMVPSSFENTFSEINSVSMKVVGTPEKADAVVKSMDDIFMVSASFESTPDGSNSTKSGVQSSKKADTSIKFIDLNMMPTSDESSPSKDDISTPNLLERLNMSTAECQRSSSEGDENAENRIVSDVFVEATQLASLKNEQAMCGWIDW